MAKKKQESRGGAMPTVKSVAQPVEPAEAPRSQSRPQEDSEARGDARAASTAPQPPTEKPANVEVRGADGRFQPGSTIHRGPDRKPRQVFRLGLIRALVAAKQRKGKPVSGFEDMCVGLREILGDHALLNRGHFLRLTELVKETFDDAPDSGSGRTTRFIFASEVEAEMKAGGPLHPGERKVPDAPPGPLSGMVELEEPNA